MSEPVALSGVVYCVDEHRVGAFYAALGALDEVDGAPGDFVTYAGPHVRLSFVRVPEHVAAAYPLADPPERRSDTAVKLVLPVADLDAARALAPSLGGSLDPADRAWNWAGGRHVDAVDPESNVVGLRAPL